MELVSGTVEEAQPRPPEPPPPPLGHVVRQMSLVRQNVLAERTVEEALPFESIRKAVVVPVVVGIATALKRGRLESEDVAEIESTEAGEVVPIPVNPDILLRMVLPSTFIPAKFAPSSPVLCVA